MSEPWTIAACSVMSDNSFVLNESFFLRIIWIQIQFQTVPEVVQDVNELTAICFKAYTVTFFCTVI